MWNDDEVAHPWVVRENDVHGWWSTTAASTLVKDVSDGLGRKRTAGVRLCNPGIELRGSMLVEQMQETRRRAA